MSLKQPESDKKFPEIAFEKKNHTCGRNLKMGLLLQDQSVGGGDSKDLPKGSENPAVSAVRF